MGRTRARPRDADATASTHGSCVRVRVAHRRLPIARARACWLNPLAPTLLGGLCRCPGCKTLSDNFAKVHRALGSAAC